MFAPTPTLSEALRAKRLVAPDNQVGYAFLMPPSSWWYHLILNARGTWLTGDERGFRSRHHRIHSSGDYKHPPPPDEHAGLYRYIKARARDAVAFPADLQPVIGQAILRKAASMDHRVLALSVDARHVHLLIHVPDSRREALRVMGSLKQYASHQIRARLPGRIWAGSGDPIRIEDDQHYANVRGYIWDHRLEGAWVWMEQGEEQGGGAGC